MINEVHSASVSIFDFCKKTKCFVNQSYCTYLQSIFKGGTWCS